MIGDLARDGVRRASDLQLVEYAARHRSLEGLPSPQLMAGRTRLIAGSGMYMRRFMPDDRYRFVGAEVVAGDQRFDLVWKSKAGVFADEIKTGRHDEVLSDVLAEQLTTLAAAGHKRWKGEFLGVRAVLLRAPNRSVWLTPDGAAFPVDPVDPAALPDGSDK